MPCFFFFFGLLLFFLVPRMCLTHSTYSVNICGMNERMEPKLVLLTILLVGLKLGSPLELFPELFWTQRLQAPLEILRWGPGIWFLIHFPPDSNEASSAPSCRQNLASAAATLYCLMTNMQFFNTSAEQIKPQFMFHNSCGWSHVLLTDLSHFRMLQIAFFSGISGHNNESCKTMSPSQWSPQKA